MGATIGQYDQGPQTDVSGTFDTSGVDASPATTVEGVAEVFQNDGSDAPDVLVADTEAEAAPKPSKAKK
jgi:hypothetical protein